MPRILVTSACSVFQRFSSPASSSLTAASFSCAAVRRLPTSMPIAASPADDFELGVQRFDAPLAVLDLGGVACWLTATRAHAVSVRLHRLSGSCRAGM